VHADLKPANALLIKDPSASDIFTSGLILYELLVAVHPYWHEDQAEYARRVRAYDIKPPALLGVMPAPADNAEVSAILHRCLSPDPAARPTAPEIRAALSGRAPKTVALPASAGAATGTISRPAAAGGLRATRAEASPAPAAVAGAKLTSSRIQLVTAGGQSLPLGIRTEIGKAVLRRFGADAEFWDDKQCTVERRPDGQWIVTPAPGTVNETLLNGAPLTTARPLNDGDVLAAGRSAKGISKLPLTARAG
jgi:hypothetical protein